MTYVRSAGILVAAAGLGLAACTTPQDPHRTTYPESTTYPNPPAQQVARYGYVESIETVAPEEGPGIGALGGAVAGGALGNQVGSGSGRAAATIGGAVIGGVVGHQVEKRVRGQKGVEYHFRVRMDDGTYRTFKKETHDNIRVGDRVRVESGNLYAS